MLFPSLFHPLFSLDNTALFSYLPRFPSQRRRFAGVATLSLFSLSPQWCFLLLLFCRREARTAAAEPDGRRRGEKRAAPACGRCGEGPQPASAGPAGRTDASGIRVPLVGASPEPRGAALCDPDGGTVSLADTQWPNAKYLAIWGLNHICRRSPLMEQAATRTSNPDRYEACRPGGAASRQKDAAICWCVS
jgi:hypothetical protein